MKNNKEICKKLKELSTSAVSDAMDKLGYEAGLFGIKPVSVNKKICGQAFTVRYIPCGIQKQSVGDFIDDVEEGQVVVIANNGRTDCTVWGDIMSFYAVLHRIEGTVIDGVCRDLDDIRAVDYPVYSKGAYMMTGKDRVACEAVNVPINVCGRVVNPGDYIFGDASGVIVIPEEIIDQVIDTALHIEAREEEIRNEIKNGSLLKDARAKNGYHTLQTKGC